MAPATPRDTREATDAERGASGRNNGDDKNPGAITGKAPISGKKPGDKGSGDKVPLAGGRMGTDRDPATNRDNQDNGDREGIPAAKLDVVYTAASKDTWDADQPILTDQLAAQAKLNEAAAKKEAKDK